MRSLDELRRIAHSGHWSFDELLEWYHDQEIEIETLKQRIAELENAMRDAIPSTIGDKPREKMRELLKRVE